MPPDERILDPSWNAEEKSMLPCGAEERYVSRRVWLIVWSCACPSSRLDLVIVSGYVWEALVQHIQVIYDFGINTGFSA